MRVVLEGQLHMYPQTRALSFNDGDLAVILEAVLPEKYRCKCRDHGVPVRITIEPVDSES